MKVIVIGVGTMGSAACAHLARKGAEVLGLDQFVPPHEMGSHHGGARMIRQSYFEHPDYVPLLLRAYALWRELEQESGRRILFETGGLYMGPPGAPIVEGALRAAREHGLPHELLEAASIRQRFPAFQIPDSYAGFYEQRAGYLLPGEAIRAHQETARRHGAILTTEQQALTWRTAGEGVEVTTAQGSHLADRLVLTSGLWTGRLLKELRVFLRVTRQPLAWIELADSAPFHAERFPCWFLETNRPWGHYGFPVREGESRLKFALHQPGQTVEPDAPMAERAGREEAEALSSFARTYFGEAGSGRLSTRLCRYTNSPDHHFIIGPHPAEPRVILAAGFSGHGFKFASVIGEILAELAVEGKTRHSMTLFSPARFAECGAGDDVRAPGQVPGSSLRRGI
ncbi:MAG TPA: N-methyl-L-tryptophan oxidase [Verrucomicrobiales bacterium]|nr:N-methyl-L-tryptophan oxidase [Verrucomicrobiales bacterium]